MDDESHADSSAMPVSDAPTLSAELSSLMESKDDVAKPAKPVISAKMPYGVSKAPRSNDIGGSAEGPARLPKRGYFIASTNFSSTSNNKPLVSNGATRSVPRLIKAPLRHQPSLIPMSASDIPFPCECQSEMRVVVTRAFNIEQKSLEVIKDLKALLQSTSTALPSQRFGSRLNSSSDHSYGSLAPGSIPRPGEYNSSAVTVAATSMVRKRNQASSVVDMISVQTHSPFRVSPRKASANVPPAIKRKKVPVEEEDIITLSDDSPVPSPPKDDASAKSPPPSLQKGKGRDEDTRVASLSPMEDDGEYEDEDEEEEEERERPAVDDDDVIVLDSDDGGEDETDRDEGEEERKPSNCDVLDKENAAADDLVDDVISNGAVTFENDDDSPPPQLDAAIGMQAPDMEEFEREFAEKKGEMEKEEEGVAEDEGEKNDKVPSPSVDNIDESSSVCESEQDTVKEETACEKKPPSPSPSPSWSSIYALSDWLLAGPPLILPPNSLFLSHPIEQRRITDDELRLCVSRLLLLSRSRATTAIGLVVEHADQRWMTMVPQDVIELSLSTLCEENLLRNEGSVFTKIGKSDLLLNKSISLLLARYAITWEQYQTVISDT